MVEDEFSPQSNNIREFVRAKGSASRTDIQAFLGISQEASKKAIQRAVDEQGIDKDPQGNFYVGVSLINDDESD